MSVIHQFFRRQRSEDGSALVWVLLVFTIISIAVTTVLMVQGADAREIQFLENRLTAYYASVGGMEFGLAALMSAYGGTSNTMLDWCIANYSSILDDGGATVFKPYTYIYYDGTLPVSEVTISIYGKRLLSEDWIVVEAVGKDTSSGVLSTNYLRINKKNIYEVHRDGEGLPK